jgi:hypothetical protein
LRSDMPWRNNVTLCQALPLSRLLFFCVPILFSAGCQTRSKLALPVVPPLFGPVERANLPTKIYDTETESTIGFVRINFDLLRPKSERFPRSGQRKVAFNIDHEPAVALVMALEELQILSSSAYRWAGRIEGDSGSRVTLTVRNGVAAATVRSSGRTYGIRRVQGEIYRIAEIHQRAFPPPKANRSYRAYRQPVCRTPKSIAINAT